jgi:hypothetical protein
MLGRSAVHRHPSWYRVLVALLVLLAVVLAPGSAGGMPSGGPPPSTAPVPLLGGAESWFRLPSSSPRLDAPLAQSVGRVAATPQLPGDFNGDGIVDVLDYGVWRQNFGATNCGNPADADGNCLVDVRDYGVWRQRFGQTQGTATPTATSTPTSTATPTKDRMYVANSNSTTVSQVLNVGGTPTVVPAWAAGFNGPVGMALEP